MRYLYLIMFLILTSCVDNTITEEETPMADYQDTETKRGWSQSSTMNQGQGVIGGTSLQANFENDPRNYTAQFRMTGDLRNKKARAEITWSVEGNSVRRIVSIADGLSVQGTGQGVRIVCFDESGPIVAGIDTSYVVSIQVVPGTRGSTSNPPVLDVYPPVDVATGANLSFNAPTDGGVISIAGIVHNKANNPIADQAISLEQIDAAGNVLTIYDPREFFWMPFAPGCRSVRFTNHTGDTITVKPIFGIDG